MGYLELAVSPTPGQRDLVIKLFANFGKRYRFWSPEGTTQPPNTCHAFSISYSCNYPSKRGRPPRAACLEAEGCLGALCSHQDANMTADRARRLQSILLRCSDQKTYCEGPMTLRTPRGGQQLVLKAGFNIRDTGLGLNLCPV